MNSDNKKYNLFEEYTILSCGTLQPELNFLKSSGFLNNTRVLYTPPGLHERPEELKKQLQRQLENAGRHSDKIIVVYGSRCYINSNEPSQDIDILIQEGRGKVVRINAKNCIDMLVDKKGREEISEGKNVYWFSPGWIKNWEWIFRDWDKGKANETFPQCEKAILLDGINFFSDYSSRFPEKILQFSDWLGIAIEHYEISLDRFKTLLVEAKNALNFRT